jgi:hypothetical protein
VGLDLGRAGTIRRWRWWNGLTLCWMRSII